MGFFIDSVGALNEEAGGLKWRARAILETARGRLPFHYDVSTALSPRTVWYEFERALSCSNASEMWPDELVSLNSDGLEPGAVIEAQIRTLGLRRALTYRITACEPGRNFAYVAGPEHIFRGGGLVEIHSPLRGGTRIVWRGLYEFGDGHAVAATVFRFWFRRRFFESLSRNLRRMERQL